MAKKEKALEESQAKKAESEGRAAETKREDAERQARLARLAPFHSTRNELSTPEPATSADTGGDIDGACNMMWPDSDGVEDDGSDGASGSPDQINKDGEPDFKVEDEYDFDFGDLDEAISKLIKPEASLGRYKREPTQSIESLVFDISLAK